ncbi:MAG: CPBP family intramembrane metalloprotease [Actinomycetota bacterium]|nr:CPBP family intramembrane metalloprotease [Actinomycetota bacterium]
MGQILGAVLLVVLAIVTGHAKTGSELSNYLRQSPAPIILTVVGEAGLWLGFGGAPWLASRVRGTKRFIADMGLRFRWGDLWVGALVGVAGQYVIGILYLPFTENNPRLQREFNAPAKHLQGGVHGAEIAALYLVLVVGAPLFEELFFRGLILPSLLRLFGRNGTWVGTAGAIVLTGLLFGLAHFEPLQFAGLALFGMALSFLAWWKKRLGPNIIAHASFNLVSVIALTAAVPLPGLR